MSLYTQPDLSHVPTRSLERALRRHWRTHQRLVRGYSYNLAAAVGETITAISRELDRRSEESK